MKATGIVRRIDELGRVVIPKNIRRQFKIQEGDPLEIFISEDGIVLAKYDNTPDVEEEAQTWLRDMKNTMDEQDVQFSINGDITACLGIDKDGLPVCGFFSRKPDAPFSPAVSMVCAYCRAFGVENPLDDY